MESPRLCVQCASEFSTSNSRRVPVVYCKPCRKIRNKDLLEFITEDSYEIFQTAPDAEEALAEKCCEVRLDLHKTLDTVETTYTLPIEASRCCCVSYVGSLTETRIGAREEIQERIRNGQISFGALVFKRGTRRDPDGANTFQEDGSKAWFNRCVKGTERKSLFVDDSEDHVLSVDCEDNMNSVQIRENQKLDAIIEWWLAGSQSETSSSADGFLESFSPTF